MSGNVAPIEWRQRHTDPYEARESHHDRRQAAMHTGMPGTIVSYDASTMTAVVQPSLQGIQTEIDGTRTMVDITPIPDVPVHFPGGGGYLLTFPVKPGDECWIKFSERSIDNWHQHGGQQAPSDWRMHDINDAVCEVGIRSQPNVPGGQASTRDAKPVSASTVQLRSDDGNLFVEMDSGGGLLRIVSPTKVRMECPRLEVTGDIIDHCDQQGHTAQDMRSIYNSHTHPNVQSGPANTGVPNQQQRLVEE